MARRGTVSIEVQGLTELAGKVDGRLTRKVLRSALREAAKALKAEVLRRAWASSLRRRVRVWVDKRLTAAGVTNRAAWINVAEKGRRPGAKAPPATALQGGYLAARTVKARGLAPRPVMAPAAAAMQGQMGGVVKKAEREMEAIWRA